MGKWYQIAAIPASFQRDCVGETTAEYAREGDLVSVLNSCRKENGELKESEARARVNKKYNDPSKLQVTFVKIFGAWIWWFGGDYWILDIDDDYSYSVVGGPDRDYLWILSRSPLMDIDSLRRLDLKIKSFGYNTCDIIISQDGSLNGEPLCAL